MSSKSLVFAFVFLTTLILDQATKLWVYTTLEYRVDEVTLIPGFLSIVHAQNPGAAFSILDTWEYRHLLFLGFTAVAIVIVLDMWRRLPSHDRYLSISLGLILSGAVGNGIDRLHKQTVTDFIRVFTENPSLKSWLLENFGTAEWPTFNIADAALLIGVILFLAHAMFSAEEDDPADFGDVDAA